MLIIPCGHNVCRQCSKEDDLCAICSCEIQSFTRNIMLKQVISNFTREQHRNSTHSSRLSSRSNSSSGARSKDDTGRSHMTLLPINEVCIFSVILYRIQSTYNFLPQTTPKSWNHWCYGWKFWRRNATASVTSCESSNRTYRANTHRYYTCIDCNSFSTRCSDSVKFLLPRTSMSLQKMT